MYQFNREDAFDFARHVGIKAVPKGDQLVFRKCPFCGSESSDKEKFAISLRTGQYNCFRASCGAKGNMITLSKAFDFQLPGYSDEYYNRRKRYLKFPTPKAMPPASAPIYEYLEKRGISRATADKYGLTVDKANPDRIVFPFYSETGELEAIKFRNIKATRENGLPKELFFKPPGSEVGCKPILFGMQHCDKSNPQLVLTEGQLDSLSCAEAGIPNAVSVPTGARGFTWLSYCWDFLRQFKVLIVFGDYEHGKMSLLEDMKRNFPGTVMHVDFAKYRGCKDANEILQKHGREAVADAVITAVTDPAPGTVKMRDVTPEDLSRKARISTGFRTLDRVLGGFFLGTLTVITGETGLGKSTLASQFATFAVEAGFKTFVYSGELSNANVRSWFDVQSAGPGHIVKFEGQVNRGFVTYGVKAETARLLSDWYGDCLSMYDNDFSDMDGADRTVLETIEEVVRDGYKFVLIDNIMTAVDEGKDWLQMQTGFCKKLRQLASARDVAILLVAHMRKSTGYNRSNDDVAGSSNITNLADTVMSIVRPREKDGEEPKPYDRELVVSKNRTTGELIQGLPLYYDKASRRLSEEPGAFGWQFSWLTVDDIASEDEEMQRYIQTELPFDTGTEGFFR